NLFKGSTWIVQEPERNAMLAALDGQKVPGSSQPVPSHYSALKNAKTIILANLDDYDVFGDGTVVIKPAPGHTAGHQVVALKLPKTGRVLLAGDLYHLQEERVTHQTPKDLEYDAAQSKVSREKLEEYAKKNNMPLWLAHDSHLYEKLKKAPAFIE